MKFILVGAWAVVVTLGAGFAVAHFKTGAPQEKEGPRLEGLRYTSLPTLSVPVVEAGRVSGYVVVRLVYTADTAILGGLVAEPGPFLTDEIFRSLYGRAETVFGRLVRLDLDALADTVRTRVNERLGDEVVQDVLIDGLNYIDLTTPEAAAAARATAAPVLLAEDGAGASSPERGAAPSDRPQ